MKAVCTLCIRINEMTRGPKIVFFPAEKTLDQYVCAVCGNSRNADLIDAASDGDVERIVTHAGRHFMHKTSKMLGPPNWDIATEIDTDLNFQGLPKAPA